MFFAEYKDSAGVPLTSVSDFLNAAAGTEFTNLNGTIVVKESNGSFTKKARDFIALDANGEISQGMAGSAAEVAAGRPNAKQNADGSWDNSVNTSLDYTSTALQNPLLQIPFRRQNDEIRMSGVQSFSRLDIAGTVDPLVSDSITYVHDHSGMITPAEVDTPRFERMADGAIGLLMEGESTNYWLNSEDLSLSTIAGATVVNEAVTAPDGSLTADKLVEIDNVTNANTALNVASTHDASQLITNGSLLNCVSVYVRPSEITKVQLNVYDIGLANIPYIDFDLTTNTYTSTGNFISATIEDAYNGWKRISLSLVMSGGSFTPNLYMLDANGAKSYQGDGISGLHVWGAQVEPLSFPSSYIRTNTGIATTRAADALTIPGIGNRPNVNEQDYSVKCKFDLLGVTAHTLGKYVIRLGPTYAIHGYFRTVTPATLRTYNGTRVNDNGIINAKQVYELTTSNGANFDTYIDGTLVTSTVSLNDAYSLGYDIGIGSNPVNQAAALFGHIRDVAIYDVALPAIGARL